MTIRLRSILPVLSLAAGLAPGAALANPTVFASTGSAVNPGVPLDLTEGSSTELAHLFVEFGTTKSTGTPCVESANGDEVCGFDVEIELTGDLLIVDFAAEPGVEFAPEPPFSPTTKRVRAVGVMAVNPADPTFGAQKIGILTVDTTGTSGGTVDVRAGAAVRSNLAMLALSSEVVAATELPEPRRLPLMASGVAVLWWLQRRRSRRPGAAV